MRIYRLSIQRVMMAVALLTMVSMGAMAEVEVKIGTFTGGEITASQGDEKNGEVEVTLTVAPADGYTITKDDIEVYATISPNGTRADDPQVSGTLELKGDDPKDLSEKRDYTVTVKTTFGLWVKVANFKLDGSKGGGTRSDFSGTYFIKSESSQKNTAGDYYICPTKNWYLYKAINKYEDDTDDDDDNGKPFLTTYQCLNNANYDKSKAVWTIVKHPTEENCYYIIQSRTGRYMVSNGKIGSDANRMRVHLENVADADALSALGDFALFEITSHEEHIDLVPHSTEGRNGDYTYLVVNFKNFNELIGSAGKTGGPSGTYGTNTAGIIGLYNTEENHRWSLDPVTPAPVITNNYDGTITITGTGTIYYTTDGTMPTTSSSSYSTAITLTDDITVIRAMAKDGDSYESMVVTEELPKCEKPVITISSGNVSITSATAGASVYYTIDNTSPSSSSTLYSAPFPLSNISVIRAVAIRAGYVKSGEAYYEDYRTVSSSTEMTNMHGLYRLASNFTSTASIGTALEPFDGVIDGQMNTISGLSHPLVAYANDATIKNVILNNVGISGGTNVGAICGEATGTTRIYNCGVLATSSTVTTDDDGYTAITSCSSTISGSGYVGSIVGLLDSSSRVINCFSYANVSGGTHVGGIVGYNNVATTSSADNLKTMVMNCMFYGEVSGGSIAPIYNGVIITNDGDADGVNNFNYFRLEASYIQDNNIAKVYNCALGAETRFLQRFEFFRYMLNSNRELAAWWATGSAANKDEMMKWVLVPSQIGSSTPYPILKTPYNDEDEIIKYPSVVNIDAENAPLASERNKGGKLGTLSVTIQSGSGAYFEAPTGASITKSSLTLNITDKDADHFNFNYYKVQLPYYNEVGTGNYTGNRVVTGWKIVSVTTDGSVTSYNDFTTGDDAPAYNFADRRCTDKDIYSDTNKRVFNQGAYWDVPEGVTAITIQPYWGKAVYLSDAYWDVTYQNGTGSDVTKAGSTIDAMTTPVNVTTVGGGQRYENGKKYDLATHLRDDTNGQIVYTSIGNAIAGTALYANTNEATYSARSVYDYAVVLVGNYHHTGDIATGGKPYTVTSVDLDGDNEPDYSFMLRFNGRTVFHPVRYDFLNLIGLGMAQKTTGGTGSYNLGIMQPKYWFEVTNTSLFRVTQFEYDRSDRVAAPYIVQGGVMEQWVSGQNNGAANNITYFHVGGNVWFKEFHRGTHQDKTLQSKHPPVSVTGGDYDEFYLTGLYTANVTSYADNAECYINGGRFGTVAGAAMEGIGKANGADNTGNITWQVQNADIKEFFAGGINAAKPVTGNLNTTITGGKIDLYCGGPKFGDMSTGKTVITNATDCIFGTFFGAGYGGNSYSRQAPTNHNNLINFPHNDKSAGNDASWNSWLARFYTQSYNETYGGVSTQFSYQFLPMSGNFDNCARIFVEYVKFSLATCCNVTSTLTGCEITGNFYGGGSLGKVEGPVTSTLTNCLVQGSAFGAGFSASLPSVEVMNTGGFQPEPYYYTDLGTYRTGVPPTTTTYTWVQATEAEFSSKQVDNDSHILYTTTDLTALGKVTGKATLNIEGSTTVAGSVYGGGEESNVEGNTEVNVTGGTVDGNVYGGGNLGSVGTYTTSDDMKTFTFTEGTGECRVTIDGGTIGASTTMSQDGTFVDGNVYGAGKGEADTYWCEKAMVYKTIVAINGGTVNGTVYGGGQIGRVENDATVVIGKATPTDNTVTPIIAGNVFGAGAGLATHGYSALLRGDTEVTVQGYAQVGLSVYGGGEIASVGRFDVNSDGLPTKPKSGGTCKVTVKDNASIGPDNTGDVFGSCKGITPSYRAADNTETGEKRSRCMKVYDPFDKHKTGEGTAWNFYEDDHTYVWEYFADEAAYLEFLKTLALASHTEVTLGGSASVNGSVYGGGQRGITLGHVDVNMTGGTVAQDVYGGGALADTNKGNWDENSYEEVTGLTADISPVKGLYTRSGSGSESDPYIYTIVSGENPTAGSGTYYRKGVWAHESKSAWYTTHVSLTGGTIVHDAYGGGLGQREYGTKGQSGYVSDIEAMVYGDVLVELNGKTTTTNNTTTTTQVADDAKGCIVNRVFGCNNLNGTPKGKVQVYVYATQSATTNGNIKTKTRNRDNPGENPYDVQAVYGGGNLAPYIPYEAILNDDETNTARTEVYIDGCYVTSIKQVYGGGNAAPVPATYVEVMTAYEIDEVFGGGNGADKYSLLEGGATKWYENPGANVGYYTYASYPKGAGQGSGTTQQDPYLAVEIDKFSGGYEHKENRLSTTDPEAIALRYGSGIATLLVEGGTIHTSYGGSNSKGNVRSMLASTYSSLFGDGDPCAMAVGTSYGGGKNAYSDADAEVSAECAKGVKEMFGGSKDADFNGNIDLRITNGSSLERVFGGNNTSGAVNGSITVTIEEGGCEPIHIGSLYAGGYLAPYSVYGYNDDKTPKESGERLYADPRINVISATRIDNIFGGGYQAKLVGNPHINVNMKPGRILASYVVNTTENPFVGEHKDENNKVIYVGKKIEEGTGDGILEIGTIGTIYGGGNMADIIGSTFVEIGTGTWHNQDGVLETVSTDGKTYTYNESTKKWVDTDNADNTSETAPEPVRYTATITGNVYGGGNNADVKENTYVTISGRNISETTTPKGSTTIEGSVYGGGNLGSVGTFDVIGTAKPTSCSTGTGLCTVTIDGYAEIGPDDMQMKTETGYPYDAGHVFGASRGESKAPTSGSDPSINTEVDYKTFVDMTEVTIGGYAFVKGSVYGGSENGHVLHNTHVVITDKCQIGNGDGVNRRYTDEEWAYDGSSTDKSLAECAHWPYGNKIGTDDNGNDIMEYLPYDIYKDSDSDEIPDYASDGHTFYGNVFGGGSGYYPYGEGAELSSTQISLGYSKGAWLREAGAVYGNTVVDITGGHILTSVYGGNEQTDVTGTCTINMSDGTVGVPRTVAQAKAHPVTCYVFGAGKGDQRINFNTWTNVASTQVNISGKARIFGSTFGGGEDGHVIGNAETNIGESGEGKDNSHILIGTTGTSSVDGNIFGGGRGFSETALTAGVVGGNVTVNIHGGTVLGTVFGGGRLASVGTNFANAEDVNKYGKMQGDVSDMNHGVIRINIYGGTIGATDSDGKLATSEFSIGDVFGGSKGSVNNDLRFGLAKHTYITMTGGKVNGSVYGGGEVAVVEGNTTIDISGGEVGDGVTEKGGDKIGNVYGGGKGNTGHVKAGLIMGNTNVTISQAENKTTNIYHNVYGGGAYGSVGTFNYDSETSPTANITGLKTENTGAANITITGGTIGTNGNENGMIFGSSRGDVAKPVGNPAIDPNDKLAWVYSTDVKIGNEGQGATFTSPQIYGSVYGSGENGHTWQNTAIDIYSGTIGTVSKDDIYKVTSEGKTYVGADYPYRGNVYGGGCGTDKYASTAGGSKDTYNPLAGVVRGTTTINIKGGQVAHNIYGAGAMGSVGNSNEATSGKTTINITGGRIGDDGVDDGNIYGAARGDSDYSGANSDNLAQVRETDVNIQYATTPDSDNADHNAQLITGSVFGGGEAGIVTGDVAVNMLGGRVLHDVYGGGALASSNKDQYRATDPTNAKTIVNLLGGAIEGDAYGGGLGRLANDDENVTAVEAFVGNTKVNLNGLDTGDYVEAKHGAFVQAYKETESSPVSYYIIPGSATGCSVSRVFGCNNLNGTPKGNAVVHVYRTQGYTGHTRTPVTDLDKEDDNEHKYHSYEVDAVYGGGNLSAYIPKDLTEGKTHVIIEGCDLTSIRQVYGGGNAASTPATLVDVHGSYEIEEVFGGGNGMDDISLDGGKTTIINPGANVGFKDYWDYDNNCDLDAYNTKEKRQTNPTFLSDYVYGSGKAEVNINSGRVHRVFGGSNTRGNVRETALTILEDEKECDFFNIDEAYGGGKSAPMDAEAKLLLSCIPQLKVVYGGAQDADISNDVVLNISNGTFDRVFGGNNKSGSIHGAITVNIEETGCKPVIIGQLYGGGNLAPYTGPLKAGSQTERQGPTVNVKAFTSIGEIYGGGFGAGADVTGDTHVNINEVILSKDETGQTTDYSKLPFIDTAHPEKEYEDIELSDGSKYRLWYRPVKNAGTEDAVAAMGVIGNVYGGGNEAKVIGNTYVNIGNKATETIVTLNNRSKDVKGVDIRGNVYGGGNQADVTGDTNVKVGKAE